MKTAPAPETIGGRYIITGRIGSGGMGEVFRARDSVLGRTVALKVLPVERALQRGFVERFRAEAQAAARLSHHNVVQVYDWGEEDETYYMVMEYVRGRNLRQILSAFGRLEPAQACETIQQVLTALSTAHERGLVHRDIKPENVIISVDGTVKVTDFGIARVLQSTTMSGSLLGTIAYAAPEQASGGSVDSRTDIYSAGCVFYELLTGHPPFEGDAAFVLHQHLTQALPPVSASVPEVRVLDTVIAAATAVDPEKRYGSAAEMRDEVRTAQRTLPEGSPLSALPQELTSEVAADQVDTVISSPRKKKKWGRWVVLALLAIAAGVGLFMMRPAQIPQVLALPQEQAGRLVEAAGLEFRLERAFSDGPENHVIRSDPRQGQKVRRGSTVTLVISAGPALTDAPLVTGLKLEEARARITEAKLVVGNVAFKNTAQEKGVVLEQIPQPGRVRRGDPVNLVVSGGPAMVSLPAVAGKTPDEATKILQEAEFSVVREEVFSEAPAGKVAGTAPPAGAKVQQGTAVKLQVSKGPAPFGVPDVKGKPCSEAKTQLEALGLTVVARSSSGGAASCGAGRVLEQDPLSGSNARKGQEATLYVA